MVHQELAGGEVVLLHLETGAYHELDPVGAAIWDLLDGERDPSLVAGALRTRVKDPPDNLEAEVTRFLGELRERDLIR